MIKTTNSIDTIPDKDMQLLRQFARAWSLNEARPRPKKATLNHWNTLIATWIEDDSLPLFIRKGSLRRGQNYEHSTGRFLIPVDNSPAQWAFSLALLGENPTIQDIRSKLANDQIPIAMILKTEEKKFAHLKCTLTSPANLNSKGWKLGHIEGVGLSDRTPITEQPIENLKQHFVKLMSPSNMFLMPLELAGLAEIPMVVEEMRKIATLD
jgi:hypothetical protein